MAWWLYKLTKPFRDFKWRLKMWIQWHYFFMWKKTYEMWYDEDSHKWKKSKCYNLAKYDSYDWYNGIWSILKAMDMKTFWIWFKLRQDGNHAKSYIHAADFLNHAAEKDIWDYKARLFYKIKACDKICNSHKLEHGMQYWIDTLECDKSLSEDGNLQVYLEVDYSGYPASMSVVAYTHKKKAKQPKKPISYTMNSDDDGHISWEPTTVYVVKDRITLGGFICPEAPEDSIFQDGFWTKMKNILEHFVIEGHEFSIDASKALILSQQTIEIMPWEINEYCGWEDNIKPYMRGLLWDLRGLAHIHHLIKNVRKLSNSNDKYSNWLYVKGDERKEVYEKDMENYHNDLKASYNELMTYLCEHHHRFWD